MGETKTQEVLVGLTVATALALVGVTAYVKQNKVAKNENNDPSDEVSKTNELPKTFHGIWRDQSGHGYYEEDSTTNEEAEQQLFDKIVKFAEIEKIESVMAWKKVSILVIGSNDVYISKFLSSYCTSLGFIPEIVTICYDDASKSKANEKALESKINQTCRFEIDDPTNLEYGANTFDVIWCQGTLENKKKLHNFLKQCYNQLKPKGKLIFATLCSKSEAPSAKLPALEEYQFTMETAGFKEIALDDWSKWVLRADAYHFKNTLRKFKDMASFGAIKFGVIVGEKPNN